MSAYAQAEAMTVAEEAQRYLAVVDAFRAEGCEPDWRPETWVERVWLNRSLPALRLGSDQGESNAPTEHVPRLPMRRSDADCPSP